MISKDLRKRIGVTAIAILMGSGCVYQAASSFQIPMAEVNAAEEQTEASSKIVIDESTVWKYLDDNTDPANGLDSLQAWTLKNYNDTAWKSAVGKFGAKRGELVEFDGFTPTVLLSQYIEGSDKVDIPAYFFRTNFQISDLDKITSITGTLFHDDAVAVYINGTRVIAADMPEGAQENNMFYAGANGGAPKQLDFTLTAEQIKHLLVEGDNVLSVELHNDRESSSDIYFEFQNLKINYNGVSSEIPESPEVPETPIEKPITQKSLMLTVGSDITSRGITWYSDSEQAGEVQFALKSGDTFPEKYETVTSTVKQANDAGFYSNQATMTGLQPGATYIYRVVNGTTVSEPHIFVVDANDGTFNFAFAGDPQIGSGKIDSDIVGWNQTLDVINNQLNADFLLSTGDQVNKASNENEYAGYINDSFASLPSATTIGNHDSGSAAYSEHFNLPNESADKGITTAGSDYWFVYENTLFVDINSNNRSTAEHKAFMEEAIAQNPDVKWKTVIFHHSIYSTASHYNDSDIVTRRNELPPVFEELGIDVVLMGHDHVYTRTFMMDTLTPNTAQGDVQSVTNPTGILYLTANSASGSKYYGIKAPDAEYAAKMDQSKRRTVTDVNVTDTSYAVTTYFADDMSVLDTFTIYKTDHTSLQNTIDEIRGLDLKEELYTKETRSAFQSAFEKAVEILNNNEATQEEIDHANAELILAKENLREIEKEETTQPTPGKPDSDGSNTDEQKPDKDQGTHDKNQASNKNDNKNDSVKTGDVTNVMATGLVVVAAGSVILVTSRKKIRK